MNIFVWGSGQDTRYLNKCFEAKDEALVYASHNNAPTRVKLTVHL